MALSLGLPQPAVNRRHAFLESGLSSLARSHPAIRNRVLAAYAYGATKYFLPHRAVKKPDLSVANQKFALFLVILAFTILR